MIKLMVTDMACQMCARKLKEALENVPGVVEITTNTETGELVVEGSPDKEEVLLAIREAGYTPRE